MRIVGEPITLVTRKGGGVDDYGYPLPEKEVNVTIERAIIVPEQSGRIIDRTVDGSFIEASILLPTHEDVDLGAEVNVRGERYRVDRPPFHHRSAFGTSKGGTEIYVRRATG